MNIDTLTSDLIRDEGLKLKPYKCTAGKLTIGIGRNIEDNGISEDEARYMLQNDIKRCAEELDLHTPWWPLMPDAQQNALLNMCFNMGWPRLSGFKRMLAALEVGDYAAAASEALDSKWARQVGSRAERIVAQMVEGI